MLCYGPVNSLDTGSIPQESGESKEKQSKAKQSTGKQKKRIYLSLGIILAASVPRRSPRVQKTTEPISRQPKSTHNLMAPCL